jgi:hypothetical protein
MPHKNIKKRRAYKKKWNKENKIKTSASSAKYKLKINDFYHNLKENSFCELCNESRISEFHHIKTKHFSIYSGVKRGFSIRRIKSELENCISVCPNCHRLIHMGKLNRNEQQRYEKILVERGSDFEYIPGQRNFMPKNGNCLE